jgi:hypothetical protein
LIFTSRTTSPSPVFAYVSSAPSTLAWLCLSSRFRSFFARVVNSMDQLRGRAPA